LGVINHISQIESLVSLNLAQNHRITDASLPYLSNLKRLESLNLTHSRITNLGLQQIYSLKNLVSISVYNCKLGKNAVEKLQTQLPKLQSIGI